VSRTPDPSNPLSSSRSGDGRFARGNPGGPGRPRGAVRGAASALDQVAAEASAELIKVAIDLARAGDREALKMVMARIWPQRRGRPLEIDAPAVGDLPDMVAAATRVAQLVMQGALSPQEGKEVSALLEMQRRMIETWNHEQRIVALETSGASRKTDRFWPD
jgi:hypothetical protein